MSTPPGAPAFGAHLHEQDGQLGVRFGVWAPQAEAVDLCLFDTANGPEARRRALTNTGNSVWQAFVPGLTVGQLYGFRAHGPWQPEAGQRFNPQRLLLDPWALALVGDTSRLALQTGHAVTDPLHPTQPWHEHRPAPDDNADQMPKCVVVDATAELRAGTAIAPRPAIAEHRRVLYEAHVKSLSRLHPAVPEHQRGTYAALAHPVVIDHLQRLGITTLCLLPVHQHISERHLLARGLVNHWGYNTLNAFAPDPGYAAATGGADATTIDQAAAVRAEFRAAVDALHHAGIEVVLDVVFNHTAESNLDGPTLGWRGLGQNAWYAMDERGVPHNFSGCGNSLNVSEPRVIQWVMDSLRWWVQAYGVDGFRFDLAVSLGRDATQGHAFNPHAALLSAMTQDPVLRGVCLIAEPWDLGPNGYQLGGFANGWMEWNDRFRDGVRAFWLGHHTSRGELARRVCASSDRLAHSGRSPLSSVNLLTAHDGFTLHDVTSHVLKHNAANGENNRDGHSHNLSAHGGVEGPTDDPQILHRRGQWRRALLATLFCAQGTPQLLAGDEIGHSQQGNNNAYCQDNAITWLDWARADTELKTYVAGLAALRRCHPGLRPTRWFQGNGDIAWSGLDGLPMSIVDWQDGYHLGLVARIEVGEGDATPTERLLIAWHSGQGTALLSLPPGPWHYLLDSTSAQVHPEPAEAPTVQGSLVVKRPGVHVLVQPLQGGAA